MAWENELDRVVQQQVHAAAKGEERSNTVRELVLAMWELNTARPESAFHLGYARTLLGVDLPEPTVEHARARSWYMWGRLRGHDRRGERNWVADLLSNQTLVIALLSEPGVAGQCVPLVMRTLFWAGDLNLAMQAIRYLTLANSDASTEIVVDAALTDLLARLENHTDPSSADATMRVLQECIALPAFARLPDDVRARFHRARAQRLLRASEFDDALRELRVALESSKAHPRLFSHVAALGALAELRLHDIEEIEPRADRPERAAAGTWLEQAVRQVDVATPEALFAAGTLAYETGDYGDAAGWFDTAIRNARRESRDARILEHARFFLAASMLASGNREEAARALHLMDQALDTVKPDLQSFFPVHEALKNLSKKVALKFLDAVDLGRGTLPDQLLFVALEYQTLGEADSAAGAAERVLQIAVNLDQRIEAMRVLLTSHNMRGRRDLARETLFAIRDLLMQRGAFQDLENLLNNEEFVGQALDHHERKCELISLYEEMEGRESDRATMQLAIARTLRARKDVDALREAYGMLREVEIAFPELAAEDLSAVTKLLELSDSQPPAADEGAAYASQLAGDLGHPVRVLVVGGNERQRRHHPRLDTLAREWGLETEWLETNYGSPQKIVATIGDRMKAGRVDVLLLLHWNRHETTEPALELARKGGLSARTVHYAGFTSLHVALVEQLRLLATTAAAPEPSKTKARAGKNKG